MAGGSHAGFVKIGGEGLWQRRCVKCGALRGCGRKQGGQKQRRRLRAVRGCSEVASKQG